MEVLRVHRERQRAELAFLGLDPDSVSSVFTREDGQLVHPDYVTRHFARLVAQAKLPPIRVHDLRHGAATLALASGAAMKVVQEMLGHSSITVTSDTYTSVLPQVARAAAQATADLVPRRHPDLRGCEEPAGQGSERPESADPGGPAGAGSDRRNQPSDR